MWRQLGFNPPGGPKTLTYLVLTPADCAAVAAAYMRVSMLLVACWLLLVGWFFCSQHAFVSVVQWVRVHAAKACEEV